PSCRRSRRYTRPRAWPPQRAPRGTPTVASSCRLLSLLGCRFGDTNSYGNRAVRGWAGPPSERTAGWCGDAVGFTHRLGDPVDDDRQEHDADPRHHAGAGVVREPPDHFESEAGTADEAGDDDHGEHHDDRLVHAEQDRRTRERHLHL